MAASLKTGVSVRVSGLSAKPELNGKTGVITEFDEKTGRFAVRMLITSDDGKSQVASVLIKPERLEPIIDAAFDVKGAVALESASGRSKLEVLMRQSSELHALKTEAASHSATVAAAKSRSDLPDDVWDRVCDIQRCVQAATNACSHGFPALQLEAITADDAALWSRTSIMYAHYLLGQPVAADAGSGSAHEAPAAQDPKRICKQVLKIHACEGRCRDSMLATAVLQADGPFALADAEPLLCSAIEDCPLIDGAQWTSARERDAMRRDLQKHWDDGKHEQNSRLGAQRAAEAAADQVQKEKPAPAVPEVT